LLPLNCSSGSPLELGQFSPVPEQQMIGQLSDGVPRRKTDLDLIFSPKSLSDGTIR
jgi:hypothetical protein